MERLAGARCAALAWGNRAEIWASGSTQVKVEVDGQDLIAVQDGTIRIHHDGAREGGWIRGLDQRERLGL